MSDKQIGNEHGVVNVEGAGDVAYSDADQISLSAMRSRLQAIDATYYTDAMLNTMNMNDMRYAIRVNDHPSKVG